MGTVLGRVASRPGRVRLRPAAALVCLMMGAQGVDAAYEVHRMTQDDAVGLMWRIASAIDACNAELAESLLLPSATLMFTTQGRGTETFGRAEYMARFRRECRKKWFKRSFDKRGVSVKTDQYGATVMTNYSGGVVPFYATSQMDAADRVEQEMRLVFDSNGAVKVQSVRSFIELRE